MSHESLDPGNGESLPPLGELNEQNLVKTEQYQVLFLTNNQAYFGRLWVYLKGYALNDIYYLQQVLDEEGRTIKDENNLDKQVLVKSGEELHGPEDMQFFTREAVIGWRNLKDEGKVAKAIYEYKENGPTDID